jgi:MATE family multidrug resistance protein
MSYRAHLWATLVLGLPLIGGHLAQFLIGLTDTIMLGWYGVEALAAITLAATVFHLFFLFGAGFAWAVMPMVAAFAAAGDEISLRRATRMGMWLSLIFALLVLPAMIWSEPILLALGQGENVARAAADYLRIAGWGLIPALLVAVLKSYLAALERTHAVLWIMIAGAVANAIGNFALIFGNWGAPELGLRGAALASILTNTVMLGIVVAYVRKVLPEHALFVRLWRADWEMFGNVLRLGVPIGLTTLAEVSLFSFSAIMMGWLGTITLAAHGIAIQLASATFMIHLGLSNAATVRAGFAKGRQDPVFLRRAAGAAIVLSLAAAFVTIFFFIGLPELLIAAFLEPADPAKADILLIGTQLLIVAAIFQLMDGAQVIALGLLRGVQDTGVPMILAAIAYFGVGVPASYALGFTFGLGGPGVWLGLVLGLLLAAVLLMGRFWRQSIARVRTVGAT